MDNDEKIKEYEAHKTPVPSYEEWQASYNCMLENEVLRLKNAQLKELLKECQNMIAFKHEVYEEDALIKEMEEALK